jgi:hypothetical protein
MKIFFTLMLLQANNITAKITPPNYDFNLKVIENFYPSKSIEDAKKINPKFEVYEDSGDQKILKFKLIKKDYTLDIYTQIKKDIIQDTFIRMPQYFNHDLFLKELQSKWKKQDKFVRKDQSSLYTWFNRDQMNILYHGSCSITCFPMFIEFSSLDKSLKPLYVKFNEALN